MTAAHRARIYRPTPRNVAYLARRLKAGELVAAPTETVYGLAANALDARACARIFKAKGRPANDPLIVHIHSLDQLATIARPNRAALRLARAFWPGPLSLVLPKTAVVPVIVTSGRDTVAVRMPSHRVFRRLLKAAGVPLAAPSANPFGYISPTSAEHVRDGLGGKISHILDGGCAHVGLESTIVDLRDPKHPAILRPGAITAQQLRAVLRRRVASSAGVRNEPQRVAQIAPGMLSRHYSPRTRVVLHRELHAGTSAQHPQEAFVFFRRPTERRLGQNVYWLDRRGDLRGVARRLFAVLRQLDRLKFAVIHVELAPERGLGHAINDRLRRAAAK